jgi:hypothetical protein
MIRDYPALAKEYKELHEQKITADISGMPGGGNVSRGTEDIAIRQLPRSKQLEYDAVRRAIEATERMVNGGMRMMIVESVLLKGKYTLDGTANLCGYDYWQARRLLGDFIVTAAFFRGLITAEEVELDKCTTKATAKMLKRCKSTIKKP